MLALFGDADMRILSDVDAVPTGAVVNARLLTALETASGEVDGYLVGRYALPLATVPQVVRTHVVCLARYHLMGARPDERAIADRKVALDYLKMVARGDVPLFAPSDVVAPSGGGDVAIMTSSPTAFARGNW
jgi:phage gp36-like protein